MFGPAGVGKSRLALELATRVARGFPGGVHLVELGPLTRWRHFAGPAFRSRIFDGGHFFTSDEGVVREAMLDDLRWSRRYQDHAVTYRRAA